MNIFPALAIVCFVVGLAVSISTFVVEYEIGVILENRKTVVVRNGGVAAIGVALLLLAFAVEWLSK